MLQVLIGAVLRGTYRFVVTGFILRITVQFDFGVYVNQEFIINLYQPLWKRRAA
jgi:hypothetical protein